MNPRQTALCALLVAASLLLAPGVGADVITTADGLVLEGDVERLENGRYRLTTPNGTVDLLPSAVKEHRPGTGPRAAFLAKAENVTPDDVAAQFRLALEAEAAGLGDLAQAAYERVLACEPDHLAARRALGYERVRGEWVAIDEARRAKGLVLYRGHWLLPAEVEKANRSASREAHPAQAIPADEARARVLVAMLASKDAVFARAARLALAQARPSTVLAGALRALYDGDPQVRIAACRLLSELGDEAALRALIFSGARDTNPAVRREAVLAAASFGHDDTAVPFVRALQSKNLRLVANAAEALAQLGDQRAAGYIVKRLTSHGSSTRNYVAFLNQVSYVRDYDVEIAQASNIANPDVATISEGVVLDVQVLGASFTKTWVEPILVNALSEIVGAPLRTKEDALGWYAENEKRLADFPDKPKSRAPRRREGKVLGAVSPTPR